MLVEQQVSCPYCGESFATVADASAGDQQYIEDCQVCCRPIEFALKVDHAGCVVLMLKRDDE